MRSLEEEVATKLADHLGARPYDQMAEDRAALLAAMDRIESHDK